ncbi:calcium ATPase, partial [Rickenella mellea]
SCLTGQALDRLSKAQLRERVGSVSVFARTTPRHKMAIVEAYQSRGAVVAMTGDGVNDAPALKMADIGVSMGKSGTDVAKEAADVILVDDNFSTILSAIEEGKSIFHNIQNFLSFQLSTAVAALTLITLSTFFGLSNPLNAMQILFINILMDGPPSQSLGVDPPDPAVMRKPPRAKDEPIISRRLVARVMFSASIIVFGTLFIYAYALSDARMSRRDQTMTFTCFVFLDLVSALQNRGLGCNITQNKMLLTTISISFLVQLALIYVPFMQAVFQTEALSWSDLSTVLFLGAVSFTLHEGRRRYEQSLNVFSLHSSMVQEMA